MTDISTLTRPVSECIFEGMVSIRALISNYERTNNDRRIKEIWYSSELSQSQIKNVGYLKRKASELNYLIYEKSDAEINSAATGKSHGGIIAFTTTRTIHALQESDIKKKGFYVMLEGIEDPYNFGYSLRSLYSAGVDGVILSPRNWMSAAGTVCKSSAGASEYIDMYICDKTESAVDIMKNIGYTIVCADIKNSVSVFDENLKFPIFLIVGGEKRGISSRVLTKADKIVRIDYARDFKSALSAASSATILAYEIYRQNR